jgi:hypothetical protein
MIAALREHVVPVLRIKGFKGSFPHFRRTTDAAVHLLMFQFNKYGDSFVVEVGSCAAQGYKHAEKLIPPNEMNVSWLHPDLRIRLGSTANNSDHWFNFDGRFALNPYKDAAKAVLPFLNTQAEEWWNRRTENQINQSSKTYDPDEDQVH